MDRQCSFDIVSGIAGLGLFAALVLGGCGDDSAKVDNGGPADGGGLDAASGDDGSTGGLIGPEGGVVEGPGGVRVTVPAGAVATPIAIQVTPALPGELPPDVRGVTLAGAAWSITPHGATFAVPVTVRLPYDATLAPTPLVPTILHAPTSAAWTELTDAAVVEDGFVEGKTTSFSPFAPAVTLAFKEIQRNCGLTYLGEVWCWGNDWWSGGTTWSVPTRVTSTPALSSFSVGGDAICGIGPLDRIYCVSEGNSAVSTSTTLAPVDSTLSFSKVSLGGAHACAITTSTGLVYCWGDNLRGQLGNGTAGSIGGNATPTEILPGGKSFIDVAAGGQHSCAVTTTGDLYCWGDDLYGQVVLGGKNYLATPTMLASGFEAVSAGAQHSCGVKTTGVGACWGYNYDGEVGDGTAGSGVFTDPNEHKPVTDIPGFTWFVDTPTRSGLVAGSSSTCGRSSAAGTYCWGSDLYGQIGDGGPVPTTKKQPTPTQVTMALDFRWIWPGSTTCGIDSSGATWCWGNNAEGGLGIGTVDTDLHATPERVKMTDLAGP
ncbi:MAG: hypothetical protein KC776_41735 [Myxococcales bacterium]|nr:hypothetical protein [Myxococcales bacterium]